MKYDAVRVSQYAKVVGKRITAQACAHKKHLCGEDLLGLCALAQINHFVLKVLFRHWQHETLRLKSPYFDYEAPNVRQALVDFMNVLSRHLKMDAKALGPIVARATEETLWLLLWPDLFYHKELVEGPDDVLNAKYLNNTKRYVRINHGLLDRFIARMEAQHWDSLDQAKTQSLLAELIDRGIEWEDPRPYMAAMHRIAPCPEWIKEGLSSARAHALTAPAHERQHVIEYLFGGHEEALNNLLSLVEKAASFEDAKEMILRYGAQHEWKKKNQAELQKLLRWVYLHFKDSAQQENETTL